MSRPKQPAIPGLRGAIKKKVTRRKKFLMKMDAVVPRGQLLALIAPHYPKVGPKGGRPPMSLQTMLRVYFLLSWHALSDPMADETLYGREALRRFAKIELGEVVLVFRPVLCRAALWYRHEDESIRNRHI